MDFIFFILIFVIDVYVERFSGTNIFGYGYAENLQH